MQAQLSWTSSLKREIPFDLTTILILCRRCFVSTGRGFRAEAYTTLCALGGLVRTMGYCFAAELADSTQHALEQAMRTLSSHISNHKDALLQVHKMMRVGFFSLCWTIAVLTWKHARNSNPLLAKQFC